MKIHWRALKGKSEASALELDLLLIVMITINLLWLLTDLILLNSGLGILLKDHVPGLIEGYQHNWHNKLLVYDTFFTFFLITELCMRWALAIHRKTYYRWFFYPFVHWYDVLGCIPLPAFRALRLLRLISILYRLQKIGVIDLSESSPFVAMYKYYHIVIEELSDRIVINVLEGVQREVRSGGPLTHRLANDVLKPQRHIIVPWLAGLLAQSSTQVHDLHKERLGPYLDETVRHAITCNADLQKLKKRLLFAGPAIETELQSIISGLLTQVLHDVLSDIGRRDNVAVHDVATALFDTLTEPHAAMDTALRNIVLDALELLKTQVGIQQWKLAPGTGIDSAGSPGTPA